MNYDLDYFISKFEAIPEENWCSFTRDNGNGKHCAHGHCEQLNNYECSNEEKALGGIAKNNLEISRANGFGPINNGDTTPISNQHRNSVF